MSSKPEEEEEKQEKKEDKQETAALEEPALPPEVDAFFKGKNKYKHPYGDWKPVVKVDSSKRKTLSDQLDLPADNWHLPENQPAPVISEIKDESHVKLTFKEREIPGISSSLSSKTSEGVVFKKRKAASNRQLRGSASKHD
ncbi:unnamed protein product [Rotaria socialis]|uniref:Uncharacterized protein n=1 Tax=Rotaria socialis TaxID=392032 RepID=A0A817U0D2_9BILA|nr:unnamed protein product [Rotaria socialis]CAF3347880.1 unnamed protein product [Rotaria socialis]CAF3421531.1 unnamed protein product [Rotaria socialis]CAF3623467.1 unnamed protein product [Rotaria socialis]CAF3690869.1 unnamed protein product [Rotaria socialis]